VSGKRTRDTKIATADERAGNGKNLLGKEGDVKRLGDGRATLEKVQYGLVARFDGQDGSGGSQDARVFDEVRSTKVCANAHVFHNPCDRHHSRDINEGAREVEFATRRRFRTERNEDFLGPKKSKR
jgi:hypothetical protein